MSVVCLRFDFCYQNSFRSRKSLFTPQTTNMNYCNIFNDFISPGPGMIWSSSHFSWHYSIFNNYKLFLWQIMKKASLPLKYLWEFVGHIWKTLYFWRSMRDKGYLSGNVFSEWLHRKEQTAEAGKSQQQCRLRDNAFQPSKILQYVLFHCVAPAPWSLQQRGIDPATNVSINHSRTQQGVLF